MKINNKYSIVLLLCTLFISTGALANVGSIIYGYGDYHALDRDGNKRKLTKGAKIFEGDTLVTGKRGRLHIRFTDGGMVSVYPGSEYKIDEYAFVAGDDTKQKGFFSLLRGGARQITGLLGKFKRDNFRFRTTVATIGIRGTGFFVQLCQADCFDPEGKLLPDGMYVKNDTGIINMKTKAGDISLAQGQSAFAASDEDVPQQINEPVAPYNLAVNDVETYDFDVGDVAGGGTTDAGPIIPPPPPVTIFPAKIETLYLDVAGNIVHNTIGSSVNTVTTVNTILNDNTSINSYDIIVQVTGSEPEIFDSTGGVLAESGSDQTLGVIWSRWTGGFSLDRLGSPVTTFDQNIHMIGAEQLTQTLPTAGILSYTSIDGTNPTFASSMSANDVGTQSVSFDINYLNGDINNLNITATFTNGIVSVGQVTVENIGGLSSNVISVFGSCDSTLCVGGNGLSMSGQVSINLVGANAEGAFGSYGTVNLDGETVSGSYLATGQ